MSSKKTRRLVLGMVAIAAVLVTAAGATAQVGNEDIQATRHNFSMTSGRAFTDLGVADYGEICVYCHTPHGGQVSAPLWNRQFTTSTFVMYNDATGGSSDLNMTFAGQPTGTSLACLSCHDGTIGIDVIINEPNGSSATPTNQTLANIFTTGPDTLKILGTDLRNDHPISMTYNPAADAQFAPIADIQTAGLKLFDDAGGNDMVQCATCHNPHTTNATFLRIANSQSNLCLTCHNK